MITNQKINIIIEYFQKNIKGFSSVMGMNLQQFKQITTASGKLNTRFKNMDNMGAKIAYRTRMMTHGMRGFKMEMLGVMFFGMMINRVFMGLLKTSLEWTGVTEILSETLGILFLPIALEILEWALKFLEFVSNIPDKTKLWIGILVLLAIALGGLLYIIGSFALGIGSLILAFGGISGIGAILGKLGAFFAAFGGTVLLIVAAVIAVIIGMYTAWRDNFMNMKAVIATFVESVKTFFSGLWNAIKGIINIVLGLLSGDFERFKMGIIQVFTGMVDMIKGLFVGLASAVAAIFIGILNAVRNIVNVILKAGATIGNFLMGKGFTTEGALQIPSFATGGIVPGPVGSPMPIIAHGGERVIPTSGNQSAGGNSIIINETYNVNVSDKREFENMLRDNNIRLTDEVRRMVKS